MVIHKINLINEKVHVANMLVAFLEQDLVNNKVLTSDMLRNLSKKCEELIVSDF